MWTSSSQVSLVKRRIPPPVPPSFLIPPVLIPSSSLSSSTQSQLPSLSTQSQLPSLSTQSQLPSLSSFQPLVPPLPRPPPKPKPEEPEEEEEEEEELKSYVPFPNLLPPSKQKSVTKRLSQYPSLQPNQLKEEQQPEQPAEKTVARSLVDLAYELDDI